MSKPMLLDLFCCAGGAGKGYADAGFTVTGVDIDAQPRYPFSFFQRDALDFLKVHGKRLPGGTNARPDGGSGMTEQPKPFVRPPGPDTTSVEDAEREALMWVNQ